MTDDSDLAGTDPTGAQSADSALEDQLADTLGIDDVADEHEVGDLTLPVAASEPPSLRQRTPPRAEADLSRFDAVSAGQIPPERPPRAGEPEPEHTPPRAAARRARRPRPAAGRPGGRCPRWSSSPC